MLHLTPQIELIQIAVGDMIALVDCTSIKRDYLVPFARLLAEKQCIFHSPNIDLVLLTDLAETPFTQVFDTQVG